MWVTMPNGKKKWVETHHSHFSDSMGKSSIKKEIPQKRQSDSHKIDFGDTHITSSQMTRLEREAERRERKNNAL